MQYGADVTICNNRGDTPLHNAARWNHPVLVNELLLYGARYTATNNDNRTPGDLTSDDRVQDLIWKAGRGIIAVGSYSPLNHGTPSETTGSPGSGGGFGSSGGSSGGGKPGIRKSGDSYFGKLDRPKSLPERVSKSPDRVSRSSDSREEEETGSHDFVIVEDPLEHRLLGAQQGAEVGQSSEDEPASKPPQRKQLQRPHPEGVEQKLQPKELQTTPHSKGEELQHRPHPMGGDENLRSLLLSIENFDRY